MDLNKLYFKHQLLRMQANAANSTEVRAQLDGDAAHVAGQIGQMQNVMGAAAAASWTAIAAARAINDKGYRPLVLTLAAPPTNAGGERVDGTGL